MKVYFRHIAYIFFAFVLCTIAGCSKDHDLVDDAVTHQPDGLNTIGYLSIRLQTSDGLTRIGEEFAQGEDAEFALAPGQHHFAIFYNDEQTGPMAVAALSGLSDNEEGGPTANSSVVLATIVAKSAKRELLEQLQECIVVLNSDFDITQLWTMSKDKLITTIVTSPFYKSTNGKEYFTMCNSVYIDNGKKVVAAKVDTSKIYTSYIEALEQAWKGNAAVVAYVERLAAKFSLRFANPQYNEAGAEIYTPADNHIVIFSHVNDNGIPYYRDDYASYQIKITGWGMNALEQVSYLFRQFKVDGNYFNGWYNTTNARAYWSEDRHYTQDVYPWQYRKAIDKIDIPYYQKNTDNILRNLSFDELNTNQKYQYTPENTYVINNAAFNQSLDARPELLAGTHMIVCAELLTDLDDGKGYYPHDVYRDRNGNFYPNEQDCIKARLTFFINSLNSHSFLKYKHYNWEEGTSDGMLYAWTKGNYRLYYNGDELTQNNIDKYYDALITDAIIKGGDGKRMIWANGMSIKDEQGNSLKIYTNIDEVDPKKNSILRDATPDDIRSLLFEVIGAVDHFCDGKMYYAIPIGYIQDKANSTETSSKYSIYGVVRNSVYDILIHDITGFGTSVDKPTDPIVPNSVSTNDHLFISFDVLDWHWTDQKVPGVITK